MSWLIALLAGTVTGILSAFGIGGGSLLLIYLTAFAGVSQHAAQGINLLYFLPAAAAALPTHKKNGLLEKKSILPAILAGLVAAAATALLSNSLDTRLLRKLFGLFLLYIGLRELFRRDKPKDTEKPTRE
ncbi:MAG: sulfite exporter TauE/SafE family protein [Bacillota bacterium]|nr:sulfite exporter TauE/SafE family protein [Bacillota bacterium]